MSMIQQTKARGRASGLSRAFSFIGEFFAGTAEAFRKGDLWTRLSALISGAGFFARGQIVRGVIKTLLEALVIYLIPAFMAPNLSRFGTLGTVVAQKTFDPVTRKNVWNNYDNSFLILLYSVMSLALIIVAVALWMKNMRAAYEVQRLKESGKHINSFRNDVSDLLNRRFHITLLSLPTLGVVLFIIIPLIVMILIAFTNYDHDHLPPNALFTWVGFNNFKSLFNMTAESSFGYSFAHVLGWTLTWAVLATFTCFILGILMAMFINNRNTLGKRFWRTCFMVTMAVPQFVSLLLVRNFFANQGIVNTICKNVGLTDWLYGIGAIPTANYIPFLTNPAWARPMIILINIWVGIPYQMLIATGILMNIPADLTEAARIDGANAWQSFWHITMPYILFVMGPSLVNSVVANINNFNVIYLLSHDVYVTQNQLMANANASEVDLLITWLFGLTQDRQNYKMASVIGILVFVVCAIITLFAFNRMIKGDKEESFQ